MKTISIACGAMFTLLAACGTSVTPPEPAAKAAFTFQPGNFDTLFSAARTERGLASMTRSTQLNAAAQGHANDMSTGGFFDHTGSDSKSVGQRARAQGYGYCWIAENISYGRSSEAEAFARWMASPGHRKNMLARDPTQYGLAVAPGNYRVLVLASPGC